MRIIECTEQRSLVTYHCFSLLLPAFAKSNSKCCSSYARHQYVLRAVVTPAEPSPSSIDNHSMTEARPTHPRYALPRCPQAGPQAGPQATPVSLRQWRLVPAAISILTTASPITQEIANRALVC
jgi:hypothetical protein